MMDYIFLLIYFLAAILIPLAFVLMLWGMFHITRLRDQRFFWGGLIGLLGAIPVLSDLTLTRGEYVNGILRDVWTPPGIVQFLGDWSSRGMIYLILGFSVVVIAKNLFGKQIENRAGRWLFVAYLMLITPSFISSVAGTRPEFIHFMLFEPLIFALVYLAQPSADWLWYVKQFKRVLLVYVSLSALFGVLAPSWTTGSALVLIPGFDFRLHGIFSHSNSLGMAALLYLVLDMADDGQRTLLQRLGWLVNLGVLVATQSKTAWVGAALAYAIYMVYELSALKTSQNRNSSVPLIIVGFAVLGAGGILLFGGGAESWFRGLNQETYSSLTSLTGRTNIWEITIRSWQENPIFGYGPGLWDVEYRLKFAPQYLYIVGMAHNQFIQTLGESGALGIIGLSIYMITLVKFGLQYFSLTRGVSLALVVIFLARSMSETPFRNQALDVMFFSHFILFVLLLSMSALINKKRNLTPSPLNANGLRIPDGGL